jgi:hypothetical protein
VVRDKKYEEQIQDRRLAAFKDSQDKEGADFEAWYAANNKPK